MITLRKFADENDYRVACDIESTICIQNGTRFHQNHIGGIGFDRYMFGNGAQDIFSYGILVDYGEITIGYALVYLEDKKYTIRILPKYEALSHLIISAIESLYKINDEIFVVSNSMNTILCDTLVALGYQKGDEERFQAMLKLKNWESKRQEWTDVIIKPLEEADISERVQYAGIPSGKSITEKMYIDFMNSDSHLNVLDYVVKDKASGEMAGFYSWWIDRNSQSALLEPVACIPSYRRRGISARALCFGLSELKKAGIQAVYVSTWIHNTAAQALYQSVGFSKTGEANMYIKMIK